MRSRFTRSERSAIVVLVSSLFRYLALSCIGLLASCATQPPAQPVTVATDTTGAPAPEPASSPNASPPPAKLALPPVRFPTGAPPPQLGCFARSQRFQSFACVVGRAEPDPEGTSTLVRFAGGDPHALVRLAGGLLDEPARQSLDEAMVAGDYRQLGAPEWSSSSEGSDRFAGYRILIEPQRMRVEHGTTLVYESADRFPARYMPACVARAWAGETKIFIERTCRTLDEGIAVFELYVWECDPKSCRG
jgi:hypothetical protein